MDTKLAVIQLIHPAPNSEFRKSFKVKLKFSSALIVLAVAVIIAGGYFGIVGFGLFLAAGIVALRYKPRPSMELTK